MADTNRTTPAAPAASKGSTYARVRAMTDAQRDALTDQFAKSARVAAAEPIAVIGVGCRFPGGSNSPQQYWDLLMRGQDAIVEVPADRWAADEYYDADPSVPGRMPSKWGGFLDEIAGFDAAHFGIAPREAETMDPQQRVLLEVACEALEHAGIAPQSAEGIRAAVLMGVYYNEYQSASMADLDAIDAYAATGNAHSVTVGRIAYLLGLRGPAIAVDTACSSSLVSVHLACQSLRSRESDLALAGGVNLILRPETQLALGKWGMLSPRGRCHTFDAAADGFVRGEGCGVVVLKRLTDAVRDGDRVLAVVRGTATNQDGRSNGLTAPNAPAQREVITRALGEVPASSVHFVETHGTGTALGDPIEFDALSRVYGSGEGRCALGAVKTNMGHLEAAAGIAGFIKAVLAVHRGQVPPNLHFTRWNPAIDPAGTRLYVPTEADPWPSAGGPRRAAVSSFGLGGTNAHIVLEQGPDAVPTAQTGGAEPAGPHVVRIGGNSPGAVTARADALAGWLQGKGAAADLGDVAHTVARQADGAPVTGAATARDRAGVVDALRALAAGDGRAGVTPVGARPKPGVVFVFSGQGSQWPGMGRRLLAEEPAFAAAVDRIEPEFAAQVGFSLRDTLASGEPVTGIDRIQPVLVGVQLALADLWRAHGIVPDAVIGHSMGEVTAAVVAGGLSVADGLRVIATRSALMRRELSGQGAMALLEMEAAAAEELLADHQGVSVAVVASPRQTVVAGPPERIDDVIAAVSARNLLARRVEVDVASHHATVDPILDELRAALSGLRPTAVTIPVLSTVRAGEEAPVFDADYWADNLRQPVRFAPVAAGAAARFGTLIEVSPHPVLTHALAENRPADREVVVLPTLLRDEDDTVVFRAHRARLGGDAPAGRIIDLPPHTWQHERYWTTATAPNAGRAASAAHPLLGDRVDLPSGTGVLWHADAGLDLIPWLRDHRVQGQPIMPAAGFAEIVLAAGRAVFGDAAAGLAGLEVEQMLPLTDSVPLTTQLIHDPESTDGTARVEVFSRGPAGEWIRHATGRVGAGVPASSAGAPVGAPSGGAPVSPREIYAALRRAGAHHDTAFVALERVLQDPAGAAEADIALPAEAAAHPEFALHPVALDAALQTLAAALPAEAVAGDAAYLPVAVEAIRLSGPVGRRALCRARITSVGAEGITGDVTILAPSGAVAAEVRGVFLRRIQRGTVPLPLERKLFGHRGEAAPAAAAAPGAGAGSWLVLAADAA
ncbi:type I polyketide synthase, partial [Tsukamurella columbiensis]